jgi:hypothetical protein
LLYVVAILSFLAAALKAAKAGEINWKTRSCARSSSTESVKVRKVMIA